MTEAAMNVPFGNGDFFASARSTREALAQWARVEFSSRKELARAFGLTEVQARSVLEGAATGHTIDLIWRHPRGGPRVALAVLRSVIGDAFDQFIEHELTEIARAERRLEENDRNARALWARALGRGSHSSGGAGLGDPQARARD